MAATDTPGQERVKRRQCDAGNTISSFSNVSRRTGQAATAWTVQLAQHLARPDPQPIFLGGQATVWAEFPQEPQALGLS